MVVTSRSERENPGSSPGPAAILNAANFALTRGWRQLENENPRSYFRSREKFWVSFSDRYLIILLQRHIPDMRHLIFVVTKL